MFIYVLILILLYWFYSISVYFYFPTVYYFIQLWIRINIITKMMAIIKVSCSYCSVVSYAYEINKVLYHPLACCGVFLCTLHTGFNLTSFPFTLLSISHFQSSAGLFSPACPAAPCPAPSLSLSLSLYSEAVTLGVRCLGWPHLQLYLPLCVSRSLSGLYNRSRIRAIIAPWLLTAGVYCGFVWEGRTTAQHRSWPPLHSDRKHAQILGSGTRNDLIQWNLNESVKQKVMCVSSRIQGRRKEWQTGCR